MKKLVLILCIALSGCMWQTVNESDMRSASRICGNFNNVVEISANFVGEETVLCEDRKKYLITKDNQ
jgi:hypothetical protein